MPTFAGVRTRATLAPSGADAKCDRLCRQHPWRAFRAFARSHRGVDAGAMVAVSQPAARPDRGVDLRPRWQLATTSCRRCRGGSRCVITLPATPTSPTTPSRSSPWSRLSPACSPRADADQCARRAGRGADHRRPASTFTSTLAEIQSRCDPAAVLGAGRRVLTFRAAHAAPGALGAARLRTRRRILGQIFRCRCSRCRWRCSSCSTAMRAPLRTAGPYVTAVVALVTPHRVVSGWHAERFLCRCTNVEARAAAARLVRLWWRPLEFALGQAAWLLPSLAITACQVVRRAVTTCRTSMRSAAVIVTLLTFGPVALLLAMIGNHRRQADRHVGLSAVAVPRAVADAAHRIAPTRPRARFVALGCDLGRATLIYVIAFVIYMAVDPRPPPYRAELFPARPSRANLPRLRDGDRAAGRLRHRADVFWRQCQPLRRGSAAHGDRRRPQPRALDRSCDLKRRGALVMWVESDPNRVPEPYRALRRRRRSARGCNFRDLGQGMHTSAGLFRRRRSQALDHP